MHRGIQGFIAFGSLLAAFGREIRLHNTTGLIPLAERGIILSRPQVYRIVNQKPERVAQQVLAAICDIFSCGPEDLITANSPRDSRRATPSAVGPARAAPSAAAATPARPGRAGRTA